MFADTNQIQQTLGITICNNDDISYKYNFQQKISTLKSSLNIWKSGKLSLKRKITVLYNLTLAPLIYISCVINTSVEAVKEINNIIQNFMWDGSTSKIAQKNINSKYQQRWT